MSEIAPVSKRSRIRLPWWAWVIAGAGVIIGGIAALGGFADATTRLVPRYDVGETYTGNETSVTVESATLVDTMPDRYETTAEGTAYVVVEVTLDSELSGPNTFHRDVVRVIVDGVVDADTEPASILEMRTGAQITKLQPGIPMRVAYVWPVDSTAVSDGDDIIIGVLERYAIADDPIFDDARSRPRGAARVLTTIVDAR